MLRMVDARGMPAARLSALESVSPSKFEALQKCALQIVLERSFKQYILPPSIIAVAGTLLHRVVEEAYNKPPSDMDQLRLLWDKIESDLEEEYSGSYSVVKQVPLKLQIPNYAVRKALFLKTWRFRSYPEESTQVLQDGIFGAERRLTDRTGKIVGRADLIVKSPDGISIKDYKSGKIYDRKLQQVHTVYSTQLKLYAALYNESSGRYPDKLILIGPDGEEREVAFTKEECAALLREALDIVNSVNQLVAEGNILQLGKPDQEVCRTCSSRAMCPLYVRALRADPATNPYDLLGSYVSFTPLKGLEQLVLNAEGKYRQVKSNSLLSRLQADRLPPKPGAEMLVCNLRPSPNRLTFGTTIHTSVTIVPEWCD